MLPDETIPHHCLVSPLPSKPPNIQKSNYKYHRVLVKGFHAVLADHIKLPFVMTNNQLSVIEVYTEVWQHKTALSDKLYDVNQVTYSISMQRIISHCHTALCGVTTLFISTDGYLEFTE